MKHSLTFTFLIIQFVSLLYNFIKSTKKNYFIFFNKGCNIHGYIDLVLCANLSWIILLISAERWFSAFKPLQKTLIFTKKRILSFLAVLFVLTLFLFVYFPFALHVDVVNDSSSNLKECKIHYEKLYNAFGLASVVIVYIIPYLVLLFLNIMVIIKLRSSGKIRVLKINNNNPLWYKNGSLSSRECSQERVSRNNRQSFVSFFTNKMMRNRQTKKDLNINITLISISLTFIILTSPYQVLWVYEFLYSDVDLREVNTIDYNQYTILKEFVFLLKNFNYLINFILYSLLSKLFRNEFLNLFKISIKKKTPVRFVM